MVEEKLKKYKNYKKKYHIAAIITIVDILLLFVCIALRQFKYEYYTDPGALPVYIANIIVLIILLFSSIYSIIIAKKCLRAKEDYEKELEKSDKS